MTVDEGRIESWVYSKSQIVEDMLCSDSILFPGAAACIQMCARRCPLAIASGALEPEIALVLKNAGLFDYFKVIASASDGVRGKPSPDLYMLALAKLCDFSPVDASACIAIEDSRWGLEAACKAGLPCGDYTHLPRPPRAPDRCSWSTT